MRLAVHGLRDERQLADALARLQDWAPHWYAAQRARTEAVTFADDLMQPKQIEAALRGILASGASIPDYVPALAERHLGAETTANLLLQAEPGIAAKGVLWAGEQASLDQWLSIRQRAEADYWRVPLAAWGLADQLPVPVRAVWPRNVAQRERAVYSLLDARLSPPPHMDIDGPAELLQALGIHPSRLFSDAALRRQHKQLAGSRQHLWLGKRLWERVELVETLSQGMFPNRAPAVHVSDVLAAFMTTQPKQNCRPLAMRWRRLV